MEESKEEGEGKREKTRRRREKEKLHPMTEAFLQQMDISQKI